jgi:hypothetical protein
MRTLTLFLFTLVAALRLDAAEQTLTITPAALQDWSVSGADKMALVSATSLVLPAGAQVSRQFSASAVIVHLATRPNFSEASTDWPVLSVGPAALAVVRKGGEGRLVLVVDESTTEELPWSVKLDEGTAAVDLFVAYDPVAGTGVVGLDDHKQTFALPRSAKPVEVWLSAGAQAPWAQERMQVMLLADDPTAASDKRPGRQSDGADSAGKLGSALERLRHGTGFGKAGEATDASSAVGQSSISAGSGLEVFTPPSVRRTRILEAVRTVTERMNAK